MLAGGCSDEQQVGQVGACNQQHEQHNRLQQSKKAPDDAGNERVYSGRARDIQADDLLRVALCGAEPRRGDGQRGAHSLHRRACPKSTDHHQKPVLAARDRTRARYRHRLHGRRHPGVNVEAGERAAEAGRRDADDGERPPVDLRRAADHARIAIEATPPHTMREDGDRARRRDAVLVRQEPPAEHRSSNHAVFGSPRAVSVALFG